MSAKQSVPTTLLKCCTSETASNARGSEWLTPNAPSTGWVSTNVAREGTARTKPAALNAAASVSVPAGGLGGAAGFLVLAIRPPNSAAVVVVAPHRARAKPTFRRSRRDAPREDAPSIQREDPSASVSPRATRIVVGRAEAMSPVEKPRVRRGGGRCAPSAAFDARIETRGSRSSTCPVPVEKKKCEKRHAHERKPAERGAAGP